MTAIADPLAFIRANRLNRIITSGGADPKIGIITVGKHDHVAHDLRKIEGAQTRCRKRRPCGTTARLHGSKTCLDAFPDHGEGFCMIHDVAVAIRRLQQEKKILQSQIGQMNGVKQELATA